MKAIPMLFQTELVRALLEGRKTATRRPAKTSYERGMTGPVIRGKNGEVSVLSFAPIAGLCPFGNVGDLIYVRETFAALGHNDYQQVNPNHISEIHEYRYKASEKESIANCEDHEVRGYKWVPSIHMPKHASRLTLKVTDVRIERVQDITEDQAKSEGIAPGFTNEFGKCPVVPNYRDGFFRTWNNIYNNWDQNPYVWVIEFEVIHKNVEQVINEMKVTA